MVTPVLLKLTVAVTDPVVMVPDVGEYVMVGVGGVPFSVALQVVSIHRGEYVKEPL